MNKTDLIESMAKKADFTQAMAKKMLDALVETVEETVANGEKVQIMGFGTFEARERAAKEGHNPRTKEPISIPATVVPVFKAGQDFKDKVAK